MLLCRQPWVPEHLDLDGVNLCDWVELVRQAGLHRAAPAGAVHLVRLDAWATYVLSPGAGGPALPRLVESHSLAHTLGAGILSCLGQQFRQGKDEVARRLESLTRYLGSVRRAGTSRMPDDWGPARDCLAITAGVRPMPGDACCQLAGNTNPADAADRVRRRRRP